jgi:probable poly-beta-1,6-N-acetyl-D-glucosamine export protein
MYRQIPALRGIAIIIVILNHAIYYSDFTGSEPAVYPFGNIANSVLTALGHLGIFAVPTFLFLSGCFFAYAYQDINSGNHFRRVWKSLRFILIPYLFWSILFYVMLFVIQGQTFTAPEYIKNLFVGYPYHFIPLLVFFYLISPILVRAGKQHGLIILAVFGLYQAFLLYLANSDLSSGPVMEWLKYFRVPVLYSTFAEWGIYFPLGVIAAINAKKILPILKKYLTLIFVAIILLFAASTYNLLFLNNFPFLDYIVVLLFVISLPAIRYDKIPFVRQLDKIGTKSFGLYLMNLIVINVMLAELKIFAPDIIKHEILLSTVLFVLGLFIPLFLMNVSARLPFRRFYKVAFG